MSSKGNTNEYPVRCLKILNFITIACIICGSLCLIGIGSYLILSFRSNEFTRYQNYTAIPIVLISTGFGTILVSLLGIYGSKSGNICMLNLYATVTCIVLLMEICISVATSVLRTKLEKYVTEELSRLMSNYSNSTSARQTMNAIQNDFKCCGSDSAVDYRKYNLSIPITCCPQPDCKDLYSKGCTVVLNEFFNLRMLMMSISSFVASVGNIFAFVFTVLYVRSLRQYTPIK